MLPVPADAVRPAGRQPHRRRTRTTADRTSTRRQPPRRTHRRRERPGMVFHVFHSEYADVAARRTARSTRPSSAGRRGVRRPARPGRRRRRHHPRLRRLDHFSRRIAAALAAAGRPQGRRPGPAQPQQLALPRRVLRRLALRGSGHHRPSAGHRGEFAKQLRGLRGPLDRDRLGAAGHRTRRRRAGRRGRGDLRLRPGRGPPFACRTCWPAPTPEPAVTIDPAEDVAVLPYSSGTTGTPKGVMLTHRSIATNLAQLTPLVTNGPDDRVLAVLPFFHIYGLTALMNAPLRNGATVVVLPRFDLRQFLAAIEEHRITAVYVAPPIVLALAKHPLVADYDLSSLRYLVCAAAPLDAELAAACSRRLGLPPVLQAYGMTELSPGTHCVPLDAPNPPPGAVGKLIPNTEMRIVSLDDRRGRGAGGERRDPHPRPAGDEGLSGRPAETDAMIDADGWLHTGDIGRADEDGWLYVVDRVKELIKYKGYQVAPADLEALLLAHDADRRRGGHRGRGRGRQRGAQGVRGPAAGGPPERGRGHRVRCRAGRPVQEGAPRGVPGQRAARHHRKDPAARTARQGKEFDGPMTDAPATPLVPRSHEHGITTLTLDSPHNRNALSARLVAELHQALAAPRPTTPPAPSSSPTPAARSARARTSPRPPRARRRRPAGSGPAAARHRGTAQTGRRPGHRTRPGRRPRAARRLRHLRGRPGRHLRVHRGPPRPRPRRHLPAAAAAARPPRGGPLLPDRREVRRRPRRPGSAWSRSRPTTSTPASPPYWTGCARAPHRAWPSRRSWSPPRCWPPSTGTPRRSPNSPPGCSAPPRPARA